MSTIKPKMVVTMNLKGSCETGARTRVETRGNTSIIDEPIERGGTNQGMSPAETVMAALLACTNRITHTLAERHGVKIDKLNVDLKGTIDRRCLTEDMDVPFPEAELRIEITTDAEEAAIEKIMEELPKFCPVSKMMSQSGTKVTEVWTIKKPYTRGY